MAKAQYYLLIIRNGQQRENKKAKLQIRQNQPNQHIAVIPIGL